MVQQYSSSKMYSHKVSDLVVNLELHQCGIVGHSFDDRHHAVCSDEV